MNRLPYPEEIKLTGKYANSKLVIADDNKLTFESSAQTTDQSIKHMTEHADECDKVLDSILDEILGIG